jgi:hypothetical protein
MTKKLDPIEKQNRKENRELSNIVYKTMLHERIRPRDYLDPFVVDDADLDAYIKRNPHLTEGYPLHLRDKAFLTEWRGLRPWQFKVYHLSGPKTQFVIFGKNPVTCAPHWHVFGPFDWDSFSPCLADLHGTVDGDVNAASWKEEFFPRLRCYLEQ